MKTILERKKAILKRVYGGKRKVGMCDFRLSDGKCNKCGIFIGDAKMLLCAIIGREEVENFRMNDL